MKTIFVLVLASLIANSVAQANNTEQWCHDAVDKAERSFQGCSSMGVVMAADGTPGTFGTGCTLDHVLAFANAYADVLHCAVEYHDAASIRELRDLHDMANRLSSPAAQRHLQNRP